MSDQEQNTIPETTESMKFANPQATTEWETMARGIRDRPEVEEIRVAIEDIDTILVFAGLFSAVLSSFVIESYGMLQPRTSVETMYIMHQTLAQYYVPRSNISNAIALHAQLPPFEPPEWALYVNCLWTASLIVSLVAASFGILVRSWLREHSRIHGGYHQVPHTPPHQRHLLLEWKVFEIAFILPLLLQLSLGLFLFGLCVFTPVMDTRIGHTNLSLVSGWAFFLSATILTPIVYPQCPYKVPLIQGILESAKRFVIPLVISPASCMAKPHWSHPRCSHSPPSSVVCGHDSPKSLSRADNAAAGIISNVEDVPNIASTNLKASDILLDDDLLDIRFETSPQSCPTPEQSINSVLKLLRNSNATHYCAPPPPAVFNLTSISKNVYDNLMNIVASQLRYANPVTLSKASPQWMKDAVTILMSTSLHPLPTTARLNLTRCLIDGRFDSPAGSALAQCLRSSPSDAQLLLAMSDVLIQIYNPEGVPHAGPALQAVNTLLADVIQTGPTLIHTLEGDPHLIDCIAARSIFSAMWPLIVHIARADTTLTAAEWIGSDACFRVIMILGPRLYSVHSAADIFGEWWGSQRQSHKAIVCFAASNPEARIGEPGISMIAQTAFVSRNARERFSMLRQSAYVADSFLRAHYEGPDSASELPQPIDYVRFCFFHVQLCEKWIKIRLESQGEITSSATREGNIESCDVKPTDWSMLWSYTHRAVRRYWETRGWAKDAPVLSDLCHTRSLVLPQDILAEDRELARSCVELIDLVDAAALAGGLLRRGSLFPDDLITALGLFVEPERSTDCPRLCRLILNHSRQQETGVLLAGSAEGQGNWSVGDDESVQSDESETLQEEDYGDEIEIGQDDDVAEEGGRAGPDE